MLRNAQPTWAEIAGQSDVRKRRKRERARDLAFEHLTKMYRDAEKHKQMGQLDLLVRLFGEELKKRNHGQLPIFLLHAVRN